MCIILQEYLCTLCSWLTLSFAIGLWFWFLFLRNFMFVNALMWVFWSFYFSFLLFNLPMLWCFFCFADTCSIRSASNTLLKIHHVRRIDIWYYLKGFKILVRVTYFHFFFLHSGKQPMRGEIRMVVRTFIKCQTLLRKTASNYNL